MTPRGTLVYVHGASDRVAQVADHVARIEAQLALQRMDLEVRASEWGDAVGATLDRIELALPDGTIGSLTAAAGPAPLAGLLQDGPLTELERLASSMPAAGTTTATLPAPALRSVWGMRDADRLLAIARGSGGEPSAEACRTAALAVEGSPEYARARGAEVPEADLVAATARAVAATAAMSARADPVVGVASDPSVAMASPEPLSLARSIEIGIAETVLAAAAATLLAGYVGVDLGAGLKRWATDVLIPHRTRLMKDAFLGPADALRYLRDGEPIRRFVAATLRDAQASGGPVIAMGNSLGGIILVETLAAPGAPRPDLLVTVGSQAPLLMTIGALGDIGAPCSNALFQPWLNIYDRRDFLAFVARAVWPDEPGIVDHPVDSGLGFPDSHGAIYLSLPSVYETIGGYLVAARAE